MQEKAIANELKTTSTETSLTSMRETGQVPRGTSSSGRTIFNSVVTGHDDVVPDVSNMTLPLSPRSISGITKNRPLLQLIPRPGRRGHRDDRTGQLGGLDEAIVLACEVVGGHGRKRPAVIFRSGETPRGYLRSDALLVD